MLNFLFKKTMENTNGKNIGDVLSLIESQSLKCKINSNNKYPIVFKDIGVTKYSFINGLPNMTIKCELRFIKTKYNSNVPLLNNITFPSIFRDIYDTICKKYFNDDIDYLNFNDDTFGNKKNDLVLFPKIKLNNEKLIQSGNGNYKLTIQFGSVLNRKYFDNTFKINFYIKDFEKINEYKTEVIDEFDEFDENDDDEEYLPIESN